MGSPKKNDLFGILLTSIFCSLVLAGAQPAAGQTQLGHRVTNDRISVDSDQHWQNWQLPFHAMDIDSGSARPHFFRGRYNILDDLDTFSRTLPQLKRKKTETAILNIDSTFTLDVSGNPLLDRKDNPLYTYLVRPGISRVGSNQAAAANILDGDPTTYWQPDPDSPLDKWWIEIDIGRVVAVDEINLKFVDEELGDPFRQFRVLVEDIQRPVMQDEDKMDFVITGGTEAPNRDVRSFSFFPEQVNGDPSWNGRLVEVVRIVITDTKAGRHSQISPEEWQSLPPAERGDIVYFIKDRLGFEEPVEQEVYESLSAERQGRLEYYRRELPRLADVEIWGFGDNISSGLVEGGGSVFLTGGSFAPGPAFDGDFGSNFLHLVFASTLDRGVLTVDMGATFWLDATRTSLAYYASRRGRIDGYITRGSDGSLDTNGRLKWKRISPREREENITNNYWHMFDNYADPPKVRFLETKIVSTDPTRQGGYNTGALISEYQLFSQGYPAEVIMTSDLIEVPGDRTFGNISWDADVPQRTNLEVRTRSGDLLGKIIRYFDNSGTEITEDAWSNLLPSFKGPADTTFVPIEGWSSWSRAYQESGERVSSPGLRRFLQIQVKLTTTDRNVAASMNSIEVELIPPVGERILAEVWPAAINAPGLVDTFDVFVQPNFITEPASSRSLGFDEILFNMPAAQNMELLELALGADPGDDQSGQIFRPSGDEGIFTSDNNDQLQLIRNRTDSIWVRLPDQVGILPPDQADRTYNRITFEDQQVPVSQDGQPLSGASYGVLDEEVRGDILYYRQTVDANGELQLTQVSRSSYEDLPPEEQAPIRYFRILRGDGDQFPFDDEGNILDASAYNRLSRQERGTVVGPGPLLRLRFKALVFLNGSTLRMSVRNTAAGTDLAAPWQFIEPGDATPMIEANTLSINVPFSTQILDEFRIAPNPFTPNDDGVNDEASILFSVFKVTSERNARVRIYTLSGDIVWESVQTVGSGHRSIPWTGVDSQGDRVAPGLYICQVELNVDNENDTATRSGVIAVAY